MVFQTPQQHEDIATYSTSDTARVLDGALELLVTSMKKDPFTLKDAMLFGMGIGGDDSLKLIDRSANVHEMLDTPTNRCEAAKYDSIMVAVRECGGQNDTHTGEQAPFRVAVFVRRSANAVIDFVRDDVPVEGASRRSVPGLGAGLRQN
jgi:hypothetical protein